MLRGAQHTVLRCIALPREQLPAAHQRQKHVATNSACGWPTDRRLTRTCTELQALASTAAGSPALAKPHAATGPAVGAPSIDHANNPKQTDERYRLHETGTQRPNQQHDRGPGDAA
jgi:hypothetical protein